MVYYLWYSFYVRYKKEQNNDSGKVLFLVCRNSSFCYSFYLLIAVVEEVVAVSLYIFVAAVIIYTWTV